MVLIAACGYFKIKLVHIPVDPKTFRADVAAAKAAINRNTIGLVVSAPSFAQGVIDPVEEMGAVAVEHGIPMVCCVQARTSTPTPCPLLSCCSTLIAV
jgi:sphinganine-1-phosphate aldolase